MTISPASTVFLAPTDDEPISRGKLAYLRARYRGNIHSLILDELENSGIANARLARRLRMDAGQLARLLGSPSNMTLDTLSDLLFAISGKEPDTHALVFGEIDNRRNETLAPGTFESVLANPPFDTRHDMKFLEEMGAAITSLSIATIYESSSGVDTWKKRIPPKSSRRRTSRARGRLFTRISIPTSLPPLSVPMT